MSVSSAVAGLVRSASAPSLYLALVEENVIPAEDRVTLPSAFTAVKVRSAMEPGAVCASVALKATVASAVTLEIVQVQVRVSVPVLVGVDTVAAPVGVTVAVTT